MNRAFMETVRSLHLDQRGCAMATAGFVAVVAMSIWLLLQLLKYTVDEIRANPPQPPLIGVCVGRDLPVLQQLYPNLRTELVRAQFDCWEVDGQ